MLAGWTQAEEFFPDGFRVSTNLDWTANAVVVRETYPEVDDAVVTNFVYNGGALIVLRTKESGPIGTGPSVTKRRADELGKLMAWPKVVAGGATVFRHNRGCVLVCVDVKDEKALLENVEWHLGFQRHGYVLRGNGISTKDGRVNASFSSSYPLIRKKSDVRMLRLDLELDTEDGPSSGFSRNGSDIRGEYWYWHGQGVVADVLYYHGKIAARLFLTDETAGFRVKIGEAQLQAPEYLDIVVPRPQVSVDRAVAPVRMGLRINDEPHVQEDVVKVTVTGPNGWTWSDAIDLPAVQTVRWFDVPLAADAASGRYRIVAKTLRDIDRPHKKESSFDVVKGTRHILDQDGMAIVDGVRSFSFTQDESYTNSHKAVVTYKLGDLIGMTAPFAQKLLEARQSDPSAGVFGVIEIGKGSGDVALDLKTIRAVAYLAYLSGANGIHWKNNAVRLVTDAIERELAALGPAGLRQTPTIISTDGFVFARLIGDKLVCVNTERFAAHESVLKSKRLPGGSLKLTLEPDEVRIVTLP